MGPALRKGASRVDVVQQLETAKKRFNVSPVFDVRAPPRENPGCLRSPCPCNAPLAHAYRVGVSAPTGSARYTVYGVTSGPIMAAGW